MTISENCRPQTALTSTAGDEQVKQRNRRAISASEISERRLAALRETKVPDLFVELDAELEGWKP